MGEGAVTAERRIRREDGNESLVKADENVVRKRTAKWSMGALVGEGHWQDQMSGVKEGQRTRTPRAWCEKFLGPRCWVKPGQEKK